MENLEAERKGLDERKIADASAMAAVQRRMTIHEALDQAIQIRRQQIIGLTALRDSLPAKLPYEADQLLFDLLLPVAAPKTKIASWI